VSSIHVVVASWKEKAVVVISAAVVGAGIGLIGMSTTGGMMRGATVLVESQHCECPTQEDPWDPVNHPTICDNCPVCPVGCWDPPHEKYHPLEEYYPLEESSPDCECPDEDSCPWDATDHPYICDNCQNIPPGCLD